MHACIYVQQLKALISTNSYKAKKFVNESEAKSLKAKKSKLHYTTMIGFVILGHLFYTL